MYLYHADALALGGTVVRPVPDIIESQVACSLPTAGGTASSRSGRFEYKGLISFESAQSSLTGNVETRNGVPFNVTRVSVVIEGLNILHMVMADRIVARLAAEHGPKEPNRPSEPKILTTGCQFEGLRIAGHAATVETDHGLFAKFPTYFDWQTGWKGADNGTLRNCIMGNTLPAALDPARPVHFQEIHRGFTEQRDAPELKPIVLSSFVKQVTGINSPEIDCWGPIIVVPQFGTIYLGEVVVSSGQRRVNMLRLELGSPDAGTFIIGSTGGNGSGYP